MKRRGVTVIETLMAVTVFTLAIMSLFGVFSVVFRYTQLSREMSVASNIAQQQVEQLRLGGYDSVPLNSNPSPVPTTLLPNGQIKTYVAYYEGNDRIKQVTIAVYWDNRPESRAIEVVTLIGQGGISG